MQEAARVLVCTTRCALAPGRTAGTAFKKISGLYSIRELRPVTDLNSTIQQTGTDKEFHVFSNVLKFAAAAAQESASIFDTAPLEVAQPAAGFVDSCMDWVGENKTAVIGVTAAVGVAVGAYYAWPWARDTIRGNRAGKRAPQPATAEAAPAATESARAQRTPEEIRADMEALIREAGEHLGKNPGAGKK